MIVKSGAKVVLSKLPIGDVATQYFADRYAFFVQGWFALYCRTLITLLFGYAGICSVLAVYQMRTLREQ